MADRESERPGRDAARIAWPRAVAALTLAAIGLVLALLAASNHAAAIASAVAWCAAFAALGASWSAFLAAAAVLAPTSIALLIAGNGRAGRVTGVGAVLLLAVSAVVAFPRIVPALGRAKESTGWRGPLAAATTAARTGTRRGARWVARERRLVAVGVLALFSVALAANGAGVAEGLLLAALWLVAARVLRLPWQAPLVAAIAALGVAMIETMSGSPRVSAGAVQWAVALVVMSHLFAVVNRRSLTGDDGDAARHRLRARRPGRRHATVETPGA